MVKEFLKLVNIWQSYERKISLVFFDSQCTMSMVWRPSLYGCLIAWWFLHSICWIRQRRWSSAPTGVTYEVSERRGVSTVVCSNHAACRTTCPNDTWYSVKDHMSSLVISDQLVEQVYVFKYSVWWLTTQWNHHIAAVTSKANKRLWSLAPCRSSELVNICVVFHNVINAM